jgi:Domain of unknown function (DUF4331)
MKRLFKPDISSWRFFKSRKKALLAAFGTALLSLGVVAIAAPPMLKASDHDDGDLDVRSRALSLTDLYVFREKDQNPSATDGDLVFVMNTNPRSLARVQYFFSNRAQYDFNITRVSDNNSVPTARPDITLRFTFNQPRNDQQEMTIAVIERSRGTQTITRTVSRQKIVTTPLANASNPIINQVKVGDKEISVFAGLREDPFFFDVEQFFRVRAGLLGTGPSVGFKLPDQAVDFAAGYNVNTIAVRVPKSLLKGSSTADTFDAWLALRIPDPRSGNFEQTEQLARPAVNEGLIISQDNYALYNRIMPTRGQAANVARLAQDATKVLAALGNSPARTNALLTAFLPDVMRIDTTGPSGYANALNSLGAPIRGRLLADDVVDITFAVLTNGAVTTDNVSYEGTPGNPAQGHSPLEGSFPYLALPN